MKVNNLSVRLPNVNDQGKQKNREEEIEVASKTIGGEDEEKVNNIEDETNDMAEEEFIDKLDENLEGIGYLSAESNEEAVWTAELLYGSFMKLQGVNLDYQEMEGKMEEDKAARVGKYNLHETIAGDTLAKAVEYNIQQSTENSSIDKYMVELETQNKPTRKIILIETVSQIVNLNFPKSGTKATVYPLKIRAGENPVLEDKRTGRVLLVLCNLAASAEGRVEMMDGGAVECLVNMLSYGGLWFKRLAKEVGQKKHWKMWRKQEVNIRRRRQVGYGGVERE
ncbi:RING-type E3 ubiquitin transferase [Forsythia ovata]|uniref:RING-type E3 ubiquitin transferase n=1 Tax=Forsythia ovata TaxID=205694 RepID=A0ABD1SKZ8_9LAMI